MTCGIDELTMTCGIDELTMTCGIDGRTLVTIQNKIHKDPKDKTKVAQASSFYAAVTLELMDAVTYMDKTAD